MRLTDVIRVWDKLKVKDTGKIGFLQLADAIEEVVGVEDDIPDWQPSSSRKSLPQPERRNHGN